MPVKNILSSPQSISLAVTEIFPHARFEGKITDANDFELVCALEQDSPTFVINHPVNREEFCKDLHNLFYENVICRNIGKPLPLLDISRFSLAPALCRWQSFQRSRLLTGCETCESLLLRHFSGVDLSARLIQLGLSPMQLEQACSEEDFQIFRKIDLQLAAVPKEVKEITFSNLQAQYPVTFKKLIEETFSQLKAKSSLPLREIQKKLSQKVIGQDSAAELLANAIVSQTDKGDNQIFLFVGPTGVGKTEMAKTAASFKKDRIAIYFMNTYETEYSASSLFGAPQGLAGSVDRPHFIKELEKFKPIEQPPEGTTKVFEIHDIVILFDELEKAHLTVKNALLNLFQEGYCVVKYELRNLLSSSNVIEKYYFKKCIFIGTSNLYSDVILKGFQDGKTTKEITDAFKHFNASRIDPRSFSPEFLRRFTKVVPFGPIPKGACYQELLSLRLKEEFKKIKEKLPCIKDIQVKDMPQVLCIFEKILYKDGIDLSNIEKYFETSIKSIIYKAAPFNLALPLPDIGVVLFFFPFDVHSPGITIVTKKYGVKIGQTEVFQIE